MLNKGTFGELKENQAEYTENIRSSVSHLLYCINEILHLSSKFEAERKDLRGAVFNMRLVIDAVRNLVQEEATKHDITLDVNVDTRLGQIVGDEHEIQQVLLNLLINAVKFTPERGHIEVKATRVDRTVEISVSDTGRGIPLEDQQNIFEPFVSAHTEGLGMGLTIAKDIVKRHGGKIWVESGVGKGSTFIFTLPITDDPNSVTSERSISKHE